MNTLAQAAEGKEVGHVPSDSQIDSIQKIPNKEKRATGENKNTLTAQAAEGKEVGHVPSDSTFQDTTKQAAVSRILKKGVEGLKKPVLKTSASDPFPENTKAPLLSDSSDPPQLHRAFSCSSSSMRIPKKSKAQKGGMEPGLGSPHQSMGMGGAEQAEHSTVPSWAGPGSSGSRDLGSADLAPAVLPEQRAAASSSTPRAEGLLTQKPCVERTLSEGSLHTLVKGARKSDSVLPWKPLPQTQSCTEKKGRETDVSNVPQKLTKVPAPSTDNSTKERWRLAREERLQRKKAEAQEQSRLLQEHSRQKHRHQERETERRHRRQQEKKLAKKKAVLRSRKVGLSSAICKKAVEKQKHSSKPAASKREANEYQSSISHGSSIGAKDGSDRRKGPKEGATKEKILLNTTFGSNRSLNEVISTCKSSDTLTQAHVSVTMPSCDISIPQKTPEEVTCSTSDGQVFAKSKNEDAPTSQTKPSADSFTKQGQFEDNFDGPFDALSEGLYHIPKKGKAPGDGVVPLPFRVKKKQVLSSPIADNWQRSRSMELKKIPLAPKSRTGGRSEWEEVAVRKSGTRQKDGGSGSTKAKAHSKPSADEILKMNPAFSELRASAVDPKSVITPSNASALSIERAKANSLKRGSSLWIKTSEQGLTKSTQRLPKNARSPRTPLSLSSPCNLSTKQSQTRSAENASALRQTNVLCTDKENKAHGTPSSASDILLLNSSLNKKEGNSGSKERSTGKNASVVAAAEKLNGSKRLDGTLDGSLTTQLLGHQMNHLNQNQLNHSKSASSATFHELSPKTFDFIENQIISPQLPEKQPKVPIVKGNVSLVNLMADKSSPERCKKIDTVRSKICKDERKDSKTNERSSAAKSNTETGVENSKDEAVLKSKCSNVNLKSNVSPHSSANSKLKGGNRDTQRRKEMKKSEVQKKWESLHCPSKHKKHLTMEKKHLKEDASALVLKFNASVLSESSEDDLDAPPESPRRKLLKQQDGGVGTPQTPNDASEEESSDDEFLTTPIQKLFQPSPQSDIPTKLHKASPRPSVPPSTTKLGIPSKLRKVRPSTRPSATKSGIPSKLHKVRPSTRPSVTKSALRSKLHKVPLRRSTPPSKTKSGPFFTPTKEELPSLIDQGEMTNGSGSEFEIEDIHARSKARSKRGRGRRRLESSGSGKKSSGTSTTPRQGLAARRKGKAPAARGGGGAASAFASSSSSSTPEESESESETSEEVVSSSDEENSTDWVQRDGWKTEASLDTRNILVGSKRRRSTVKFFHEEALQLERQRKKQRSESFQTKIKDNLRRKENMDSSSTVEESSLLPGSSTTQSDLFRPEEKDHSRKKGAEQPSMQREPHRDRPKFRAGARMETQAAHVDDPDLTQDQVDGTLAPSSSNSLGDALLSPKTKKSSSRPEEMENGSGSLPDYLIPPPVGSVVSLGFDEVAQGYTWRRPSGAEMEDGASEALVGKTIAIHWDGDEIFYEAEVLEFESDERKHLVRYVDDGMECMEDLSSTIFKVRVTLSELGKKLDESEEQMITEPAQRKAIGWTYPPRCQLAEERGSDKAWNGLVRRNDRCLVSEVENEAGKGKGDETDPVLRKRCNWRWLTRRWRWFCGERPWIQKAGDGRGADESASETSQLFHLPPVGRVTRLQDLESGGKADTEISVQRLWYPQETLHGKNLNIHGPRELFDGVRLKKKIPPAIQLAKPADDRNGLPLCDIFEPEVKSATMSQLRLGVVVGSGPLKGWRLMNMENCKDARFHTEVDALEAEKKKEELQKQQVLEGPKKAKHRKARPGQHSASTSEMDRTWTSSGKSAVLSVPRSVYNSHAYCLELDAYVPLRYLRTAQRNERKRTKGKESCKDHTMYLCHRCRRFVVSGPKLVACNVRGCYRHFCYLCVSLFENGRLCGPNGNEKDPKVKDARDASSKGLWAGPCCTGQCWCWHCQDDASNFLEGEVVASDDCTTTLIGAVEAPIMPTVATLKEEKVGIDNDGTSKEPSPAPLTKSRCYSCGFRGLCVSMIGCVDCSQWFHKVCAQYEAAQPLPGDGDLLPSEAVFAHSVLLESTEAVFEEELDSAKEGVKHPRRKRRLPKVRKEASIGGAVDAFVHGESRYRQGVVLAYNPLLSLYTIRLQPYREDPSVSQESLGSKRRQDNLGESVDVGVPATHLKWSSLTWSGRGSPAAQNEPHAKGFSDRRQGPMVPGSASWQCRRCQTTARSWRPSLKWRLREGRWTVGIDDLGINNLKGGEWSSDEAGAVRAMSELLEEAGSQPTRSFSLPKSLRELGKPQTSEQGQLGTSTLSNRGRRQAGNEQKLTFPFDDGSGTDDMELALRQRNQQENQELKHWETMEGCARARPLLRRSSQRNSRGNKNKTGSGQKRRRSGSFLAAEKDEKASSEQSFISLRDSAVKNRAQRLDQRKIRQLGLNLDQLKSRRKKLRFGRSAIHDWGVFAEEPISMGEMVIEYTGEIIGNAVADKREKMYEQLQIADYMFRMDDYTVVDATRMGSLARYINHSCDPNCYSQVIVHEGRKKIIVYAKRDIKAGEELCYDYKFPNEETDKIICLCGASRCRGYMN